MFDRLTTRLETIFRRLRGYGRLTEDNIAEALRDVRIALLEADVHFRVVKDFLEEVRREAVGKEVLESLSPGQMVIKVVYHQLVALLGGAQSRLQFGSIPPSSIMLVGLQGSGKTTTAAKLGLFLRKQGKKEILLVAADPRRPAAREQLRILGSQAGLPVFVQEGRVAELVNAALSFAHSRGAEVIIWDTGGRLHIDQELMEELRLIKKAVNPSELLMVADAMTGQDAVKSVSAFDRELDLSGVILTKLDGDAKGGAALSVRAITGKPIKLVGVGEKLDALEVFHPDRMASRILGMGDVLTLIEKAEEAFDRKRAEEMERKLRSVSFTLEDFREQLRSLRSLGPIEQLVGMIPGFSRLCGSDLDIDGRELKRMEAIIDSMTREERLHHHIIDGSRRRRIARGSGTSVVEVNRLLKSFTQMQKALRHLARPGKGTGKAVFHLPFLH